MSPFALIIPFRLSPLLANVLSVLIPLRARFLPRAGPLAPALFALDPRPSSQLLPHDLTHRRAPSICDSQAWETGKGVRRREGVRETGGEDGGVWRRREGEWLEEEVEWEGSAMGGGGG